MLEQRRGRGKRSSTKKKRRICPLPFFSNKIGRGRGWIPRSSPFLF